MKKIIFFVGFLFLIGCATPSTEQAHDSPIENTAVFKHKFDNVWRALQIALQNYPIKVNNSEKGLIETEFMKEGQTWSHPSKSVKSNIRYQLKTRIIKGVIKSKPAIKVIILKKIKRYKNFVDGSKEELSREPLEEAAILYRIKRELIIDHALSKLQQKE